MKTFDRAYIEITNRCNRNCSFCPGTRREPCDMPLDAFESLLPELKRSVRKVYFHVMGEPLLHPEFNDFLLAAQRFELPVEITTNGTLLSPENQKILLNPVIRQINFSIHGLGQNDVSNFEEIIVFARDASRKRPGLFINFRFWRGQESAGFIPRIEPLLSEKIRLHHAEPFQWPLNGQNRSDKGFCLGFRDQFAVLADGTLVPCCLDADAQAPFGNVFTTPLPELLKQPGITLFRKQFESVITHPLCRRCEYRDRFQK